MSFRRNFPVIGRLLYINWTILTYIDEIYSYFVHLCTLLVSLYISDIACGPTEVHTSPTKGLCGVFRLDVWSKVGVILRDFVMTWAPAGRAKARSFCVATGVDVHTLPREGNSFPLLKLKSGGEATAFICLCFFSLFLLPEKKTLM